MKKLIVFIFTMYIGSPTWAQTLPEKFSRDLDKISTSYRTDMRHFLKSLASDTVEFNPQQKAQYCSIVATYVDEFYALTDKNRTSLPFSYAHMTKQDVIEQVKQSKEMQILKDYNIQCDLNKS